MHRHAYTAQKRYLPRFSRCWRIAFVQARKERFAATQIQRIYRARIDCEIVRRRRHKRWYEEIFIPAVIRTQSIIRMHIAWKDMQILKLEHKSARRIQHSYRRAIARRIALARWLEMRRIFRNSMAAQIQRIIRGFQARKAYRLLTLVNIHKRVLAAKTILKAWVNFKNGKRFQQLLDDFRIEYLSKRIEKLKKARAEVEKDIDEITGDKNVVLRALARINERLKVLTAFCIEATIRIDVVGNDLRKVTPDDFERGWAEALDQEFSSLNHALAMGNQETRLLKVNAYKRQNEILNFNLEIEECEIELDHLACLEMENMEALRRAEVGRIERRILNKKRRAVRLERCRWKIQSNRINVLRRMRESAYGILETAKKTRSVTYASTLAFEKRAKQWDYEQLQVENFRKANANRVENVVSKYEDYAGPVQETYNDVVQNTMSLLRGWSLDERAKLVRNAFAEKEKKVRKKRGGQFRALKPEYEEKRAFDYLKK